MVKFDVGDIICKDESIVPYTVEDIDIISGPMPKYKLSDGNFKFWEYCIGWKKLTTPDEALRYGEVLTDDNWYSFNYDDAKEDFVRVRTIRYDKRIFYHKMVNGEVVEFKELTR